MFVFFKHNTAYWVRISYGSSDVCSSDLDGKGRTLMPGIVDAHGHVMALGFRALTLDLSKASSLAEAQAMIAAYAQANPGRRWIIGAGWNQERWGMNRFPTAADIEAILPDTADRKGTRLNSSHYSAYRLP